MKLDQNKTADLHIWDTLGQEKFRSIAKIFYKGSIGAFLVFDVGNRKSFEELQKWHDDVIDSCGVQVTIILLGNKTDESKRKVFYNEASNWAKKHGLFYLEVSAKTGKNVSSAFTFVINQIYSQQ